MKKLLIVFLLISPLLIAATNGVNLRSLGPNQPSNPEVPSNHFYGTYSQMLSEPISLLQCGDVWDTSDTQAEYTFSCPTSLWVFSVNIVVSPTSSFTPAPASSWTPTITSTPTTTPTGSWTPIPTYTPTTYATEGVLTYKDYNTGYPQNLSSVFLHQENLWWSDNPEHWGAVNPAFTFGMGSHTSLALFGWSDNEQTEWLLNQGTANLFIEQNTNQFVFGNGYLDLQGQWIQQSSGMLYRRSISPAIQPYPVTLTNGAATIYDANLPELYAQVTPEPYCVPVTYLSTPPAYLPCVSVIEPAGNSLVVKGASNDNNVYQVKLDGYY